MLYTEIPSHRPITSLLDSIERPQQLRLSESTQLNKWRMSYVNLLYMQQDKAADTLAQILR